MVVVIKATLSLFFALVSCVASTTTISSSNYIDGFLINHNFDTSTLTSNSMSSSQLSASTWYWSFYGYGSGMHKLFGESSSQAVYLAPDEVNYITQEFISPLSVGTTYVLQIRYRYQYSGAEVSLGPNVYLTDEDGSFVSISGVHTFESVSTWSTFNSDYFRASVSYKPTLKIAAHGSDSYMVYIDTLALRTVTTS